MGTLLCAVLCCSSSSLGLRISTLLATVLERHPHAPFTAQTFLPYTHSTVDIYHIPVFLYNGAVSSLLVADATDLFATPETTEDLL